MGCMTIYRALGHDHAFKERKIVMRWISLMNIKKYC